MLFVSKYFDIIWYIISNTPSAIIYTKNAINCAIPKIIFLKKEGEPLPAIIDLYNDLAEQIWNKITALWDIQLWSLCRGPYG